MYDLGLSNAQALASWPIEEFYGQVWSGANEAAITGLISPRLNMHVSENAPGVLCRGIEAFRAIVAEWHIGFADIKETPFACVAEGPRYCVAFRFEGKHVGVFQGLPPSGRLATMIGMDMFQVEGGLIVEWLCAEDLEGLKRQLAYQN